MTYFWKNLTFRISIIKTDTPKALKSKLKNETFFAIWDTFFVRIFLNENFCYDGICRYDIHGNMIFVIMTIMSV